MQTVNVKCFVLVIIFAVMFSSCYSQNTFGVLEDSFNPETVTIINCDRQVLSKKNDISFLSKLTNVRLPIQFSDSTTYRQSISYRKVNKQFFIGTLNNFFESKNDYLSQDTVYFIHSKKMEKTFLFLEIRDLIIGGRPGFTFNRPYHMWVFDVSFHPLACYDVYSGKYNNGIDWYSYSFYLWDNNSLNQSSLNYVEKSASLKNQKINIFSKELDRLYEVASKKNDFNKPANSLLYGNSIVQGIKQVWK